MTRKDEKNYLIWKVHCLRRSPWYQIPEGEVHNGRFSVCWKKTDTVTNSELINETLVDLLFTDVLEQVSTFLAEHRFQMSKTHLKQ